MSENYFVYFMTSMNNRVLYIGISSKLEQRVSQHKNGLMEGFTKRYKCHKLVYYEVYDDPENAILREKQLKRWIRKKKNALVDKKNPKWEDLSSEWYIDPSTAGRAASLRSG